MSRPAASHTWFVVRDHAPRATVEAAIQGALRAQRLRLALVEIDVFSDDEWPPGAQDAVREAERRLAARRGSSSAVALDPRDDEDLDIALALAPHSIGGSGISARGDLVWDVNDTGTSAAFRLTLGEADVVRSAIEHAGGCVDDLTPLAERRLRRRTLTSGGALGATAPAAEDWRPPEGWRAFERTVHLGVGPQVWDDASEAVLSWGVKTRSGFAVDPPLEPGVPARRGQRSWLVAGVGPFRVREPIEVVDVIATERRAALSYGALEGHPVTGEEAFIVHRDDDGCVSMTLRSLTRPGRGLWRVPFPVILVAQRLYRRRYLRALVPAASGADQRDSASG
ncbi:DUF1990 domain-containing protein [Isoptericola sp. F-RaC21]|uniref:DUF1990 family protein n=1 Tax=Isoptericola sp. F-RaC21 TaxID=3141452 RepID=UPI00315B42A1